MNSKISVDAGGEEEQEYNEKREITKSRAQTVFFIKKITSLIKAYGKGR